MNSLLIVIFASLCGSLARVILPYLEKLREEPETKFDRQYLVPLGMSVLIAVVTLPVALAALPKELLEASALSASMLVTIFLASYGLTDASRLVQKVAQKSMS